MQTSPNWAQPTRRPIVRWGDTHTRAQSSKLRGKKQGWATRTVCAAFTNEARRICEISRALTDATRLANDSSQAYNLMSCGHNYSVKRGRLPDEGARRITSAEGEKQNHRKVMVVPECHNMYCFQSVFHIPNRISLHYNARIPHTESYCMKIQREKRV